jgi:TP901 family phage tail tape measure protein
MPINAGDVLFTVGSNLSQVDADLNRAKQSFVSLGSAATQAFANAGKPVAALGETLTKDVQSSNALGASLVQTGQKGQQSFATADKEAKGFGGTMNSLKSIAQGLGLTFGAIGIAQAIRAASGAALEFQEAWTKVTVILRDEKNAGQVLDDFKAKIFALPPALGTAAENAQAFYQIISSGFTKPAEALELLKNSAIAAAGGFTSTEIAARSGAAVLKAYGLEVDASRHIFDVMAKTVDLGVISFEELASELGHVIPIAASNNISFEELSGSIAALTLRGLPASQAITGVRSTIASIISPSEKAAEVAEKLGIRWDAQILKAEGLDGVLKQLAGNTKATAEDISLLTGRIEATNTVMALTAKGGLEEFRSAVEKAQHASDGAGASAESLAAAQKTLSFELKAAKNEIINSAAALGDSMAPAVASAVHGLRELAGSVVTAGKATADFWSQATSGASGAVDAIFSVATAFGAAPRSVDAASNAVQTFGGAVSDAAGEVLTWGQILANVLSPAPALVSDLATGFAALTGDINSVVIAAGSFAAILTVLKLDAMITTLGGVSGAFTAMSAAIEASAAAGGLLALALNAIPLVALATALGYATKLAIDWVEAEGEMRVATQQADDALLRLAADTFNKFKQAGDEKGIATIKALREEFAAGKISAGDFQIAIGKLANDLAKLNPGAYFKDSIVKSIQAEVDKLGVKSTGSLLAKAKEASEAVAKIQGQLKGFTGNTQEVALAQKMLGQAVGEQTKRWNEYKTAMGPVAKSGKDAGDAAKKAADHIKSLGASLKVTIPSLKEAVVNGEAYVAHLKKAGVAGKELQEAERNLASAKKALSDATKEESERFLEWRDSVAMGRSELDRVVESIRNYKGMNLAAGLEADISKINTGTEALYRLGLAAKPIGTAFGEAENAMKDLGVTSDSILNAQVTEATNNYKKIASNATSSIREIELAWVAMSEAQIEVAKKTGQQIPKETIDGIEKIKAKYGELKDTSDNTFKSAAEVAKKQVSTIFTDFSKGFADILFSAGSFGKKIVDMFKEIGKSIVRGFLESGLLGLFSGQGTKGFSGFLSGLVGSIGKLFGGGGGGGAGGLTNLAGLAGIGSKVGGLLGIGGGLAAAGTSAFATGGLALGSAGLGGALPGSIMAGFGGGLTGTAGGTAAAAGGAASGGLMSTLGALATNPITIAAAAAIAGIVLTRKFTQRGRDKTSATGEAKAMSGDVWKGIVPDVQAGKLTIDEGIQAIQDRFAAYEEWLRANLKDQTVITRSIEGQRITMTEGIAALEKMRSQQEATEIAREEINQYIAEAGKTGAFAKGFTDLLAEAGMELEDFNDVLKLSEINKAQGEFAGLAKSLGEMGEQSADTFEEFAKGGPITDAMRIKLVELSKATGVNTEELLKSMAAYANANNNLQDFESGVGSLADMMEKLAPDTNPFETFAKTGEILPALEQEIYKFGLNLADFEDYSNIQGIRAAFQGLSGDLSGSAEQIAGLTPLFEQMGGNMAALNDAAALPGLRQAQTTIGLFTDEINKLLPAQQRVGLSAKEMLDEFFKSGTILPELSAQIQAAGGHLEKFQQLAAAKGAVDNFKAIRDEFEKAADGAAQLQALVKQYGSAGANAALAGGSNIQAVLDMVEQELKGSQTTAAEAVAAELKIMNGNVTESIATLEKNLKTAIDEVGVKINENYEAARLAIVTQLEATKVGLQGAVDTTREALVGVLGTLDANIQTVVNNLTASLVGAVNDFATKLGSVRVPDAPAPSTPYSQPPSSEAPTSYPESYPGSGDGSGYGYPGGYPVAGSYAQGGRVPITGIAKVHEGELVLPQTAVSQLDQLFDQLAAGSSGNPYADMIARMNESVSQRSLDLLAASRRAEASAGPLAGASAAPSEGPVSIEQTVVFQHVEDPYLQRQMLERNNANLIDLLARRG